MEPKGLDPTDSPELSKPQPSDDLPGPDIQVASEATSIPRASQKSSRKRTKTGCLTCRKRRIKCGEERPTCNNCIKSKRLCDGYNQKVVFKHPVGGMGLNGQDSDPHHPTALDLAMAAYNSQSYSDPSMASNQSLYPLAPRPMLTQNGMVNGLPSGMSEMWRQQYSYNQDPRGDPHAVSQRNGSIMGLHMGFDQRHAVEFGHRVDSIIQSPGQADEELLAQSQYRHSMSGYEPGYGNSIGSNPFSTTYPNQGVLPQLYSRQMNGSVDHWLSRNTHQDPTAFEHHSYPDNLTHPEIQAQILALKEESTFSGYDARRYSTQGFVQRPSFDMSIPIPVAAPPPPAAAAAVAADEDEYDDDDDPWDVEMEIDDSRMQPSEQGQHDLSMMLARHASHDEARIRTFTTYLNEANVLATYRPSHSVSPLNDEKTARIFCHFITATGPSLSIYERQASSSAVMFNNLPIPVSQKALWAYTLPTIALSHPPLMHAMLALGALHIAKLQQTSEGPSIKHFTYALRRVSKLIGLPKRRNEIPTLAANLLIGFYEVMLAEHSKWNIHLSGAKILVMEIDFAAKTRRIRAMRAKAKARIAQAPNASSDDYIRIAGIPESLLPDKDWEINEELVSTFTGFHVRYDNQWQSRIDHRRLDQELTPKDVEDYKMQSDLYWWYCKQDIFQAMVSGNCLLMPYEHWIYCPPRGLIGRQEAPYATMDHLCLLMARLSDFGGKDRKRKQRAIAAQGGQWRPPPGFFGPSSPAQASPSGPNFPPATPNGVAPNGGSTHFSSSTTGHHATQKHTNGYRSKPASQTPNGIAGQTSTRSTSGNSPPPHGLIPPPSGPVHLHSAVHAMNANLNNAGFETTPPSTPIQENGDLEAETAAALADHAAITSAFDLFFESLGPGFQPLAADTTPPISTPFGPALQYRTHPIACLWTFYYTGRILLHRLHPHMPPAAMMSAIVTSHLTTPYAQTVGKICAGLYYPQQHSLQSGSLNPSLGAALIESTFTLFFAAVQFMDPGQRGWTICKLRDISRLTGWQTSAAVAAGCEVAWEKMGAAGRGPAYTPTMDRDNKDERVSGKVRRSMDLDALKYRKNGSTQQVEPDDYDQEPDLITHDRKSIRTNRNARVHWALGILAVEEDIKNLDLGKP